MGRRSVGSTFRPEPQVPTPDDALPPDQGPTGPVPEENQPGHHPPVDQDKPTGPPPVASDSRPRTTHFPFAFELAMRAPALVLCVRPDTTDVAVGGNDLTIRFGRWTLETPLTNVAGASVTGPYSWLKVAGPPRLSLADGGITFATTTRAGVCIRFHEPVRAALPIGLLRHPAATVTVAETDRLVEALQAAIGRTANGVDGRTRGSSP